MPKAESLWDCVERAAARKQLPRLEVWEATLRAVTAGKLTYSPPPEYPERMPGGHGRRWRDWLKDVSPGSDPTPLKAYLAMLTVQLRVFNSWINREFRPPRGPEPGASGYRVADEKVCHEIHEMIKAHKARSPRDAFFQIVRDRGKKSILGGGTPESKSKRISKCYHELYG